MSNQAWQQMIVEANPTLFVRSYRGIPFSPGYPHCRVGWHDIVAQLIARVLRSAYGYPVYFTQILERHGRLQILWASETVLPKRVHLKIEEAVALAEERSACTCAKCGAAGRLFAQNTRLLTVCPRHAQGVPVPTFGGIEDLHVVGVIDCGPSSTTVCRRYDREADAFLEVLPGSKGNGR